VTNFAGKSLNVAVEHAKVLVNPTEEEVPNLKQWVNVGLATNLKDSSGLDILATQSQSFVKDLLEQNNS